MGTEVMGTDENGRLSGWRKSTASTANGACVEVARSPGGQIALRDSKDPDGAVLRFTPEEWAAFLIGAKAGEFDD